MKKDSQIWKTAIILTVLIYVFSPVLPVLAITRPILVKNINPTSNLGSELDHFVDLNGILIFAADDGTHGLELWRSDGTEAGTYMVKDIRTGSNDSIQGNFLVYNNMVLFTAADGTTGIELWKTDGSEAGTALVKDIRAGGLGSVPLYLTEMGGIVYFSANDGAHGNEFWRTDGSEAGTYMVSDIYPGNYLNSSGPTEFTATSSYVYFAATDSTNGNELWRSNGTEGGTTLVKDIRTGASGGFPSDFVAVGENIFFKAGNGINGYELWISDGTAPGTVMVKDIYPGSSNSSIIDLTSAGSLVFFKATNGTDGYELWVSDGTEVGTKMPKEINPGSFSSQPKEFNEMNGLLYFQADDGSHGYELWVSDGTEAGTSMVKDINPGFPADSSTPEALTNIGGGLFVFAAYDKTNGKEFWVSDGTESGTELLGDLFPGIDYGAPNSDSKIMKSGSWIFVEARSDASMGYELYKISETDYPELSVEKNNDTSDTIALGESFHWTLSVSNLGSDAVFTNGQTILQDDLPGGPTYGSISVDNVSNITNSANISCGIVSDTLTCTASGADVTIAENGSFDVSFSVQPDAVASLTNPENPGICRVDPNNTVTELDENNNDCTDTVSVTKTDTSLSITDIDPDSTLANESYTVSVTLSDGPQTGTVNINDGEGNTCSATLSSGSGSCDLTSTTSGYKVISAQYPGDETYNSSSDSYGHWVTESTTTAIDSISTVETVAGEPYTVNFSVSVNPPGSGTPTGSVTVSDGEESCSSVLSAGSGSCQLTSITSGSKTITASYAGQGVYGASESAGAAHTVNAANTTTTIISVSSNPTEVGQTYSVSFSVSAVSPSFATPTGSVTVSDGTDTCSGNLSFGSGSCLMQSSTSGVKTLTATFTGNADFNTSASSGTSHTVDASTTTTSIDSVSSSSSVTGEPYTVNFSVSVVPPGSGTPDGTVTVSDGEESCSGTLTSGSGSCELASSSAGAKTITATYAGSGNYGTSASSGTAHTVNQASTTTTITDIDPEPSGTDEDYSVTVQVSGAAPSTGNPTGSVNVSDGEGNSCTAAVSSGTGSCDLRTTTTGNKTISAAFVANLSYEASSDTEAHTVVLPNATPTDISLSNNSIAPDSPNNTLVGNLSTTDADAGDTHTYTLVNGDGDTNNASFTISGNELRTNAVVGQGTYYVRIRSTDNGSGSRYIEEEFVISAGNESPTDLDITCENITEGQAIGTIVGTLTTTDGDDDNSFTFALVSGTGDTDNASFSIDGNLLRSNQVFDTSTQSSFSIRIRVTDNFNGYYEKAITILVSEDGDVTTQNDSGSVQSGGQITIDIQSNDSPSPGQTWDLRTRQFVTLPQHGTARFGSIIYTPAPGFEGTDELSYRICDTAGYCSVGTVTITVTAPPAEVLPATGFAPGRETLLPARSSSTSYADLGGLWLEIPALNVEAPIVGVPASKGTWDTSWLGDNIGYLHGSAFPTLEGNTVLSAHVYNHMGTPAPFHNIHYLRYNNTIILHAWGTKYTYQVRSNEVVDPDNTEVLKHENLDWITLITCKDYDETSNSYLHRTIVRAVLISVDAE